MGTVVRKQLEGISPWHARGLFLRVRPKNVNLFLREPLGAGHFAFSTPNGSPSDIIASIECKCKPLLFAPV